LALDEMNNACFIVRDKNGQALGYSRTSQETARKRSRYGHRDATMILIAYRHGLRASELCGLRWDQIELNSGRLHVRRAKHAPALDGLQAG
jgi:integrase